MPVHSAYSRNGFLIQVSRNHTVSSSYSIFQKPCPACASGVSVAADRCHCGHVFESSVQNQSPQEAALRDEEMYESYLAARAEQARQAARYAEEARAEKPDDDQRIAAAELAGEVANAVEADLAAQRAKTSALRRALPVVLPPAPVAPAPLVLAPVAPTPVAQVPVIAPNPAVVTSILAVRPAPPATPSPMQASPTPAARPSATTAQKAAAVLAALKSAKARESVARARQAMAAEQAAAVVNPAPSVIPPNSFRQDQASRAEKIMEARRAPDTKDCPNCTASVPLNTTRCHCGFAFISGGSDMPSLTLCTGDFTALRENFKLGLR